MSTASLIVIIFAVATVILFIIVVNIKNQSDSKVLTPIERIAKNTKILVNWLVVFPIASALFIGFIYLAVYYK